MHKHTKLLPYQRQELYLCWKMGETVTELSHRFSLSRPSVYAVIKKAKLGVFGNYSSMNYRYRSIYYGLRKLSRTERILAKKLERRERRLRRYEKQEPGELVHFDTKKLPVMLGESMRQPREYLHVAIDDFSRMLCADILPDKTSYASAIHLEEAIHFFPFAIQTAYSDNGSEYRGRADHPFVQSCTTHGIPQKFTKPQHPQTNGKAERVIKTIMTECFKRSGRQFRSRDDRRKFLYAYVAWYNQVRPHQSLKGISPLQRLELYLSRVQKESKL